MSANSIGGRSMGKLSNMPQLSAIEKPYGGEQNIEIALQEKDNQIGQLRETVEILELKIKKLEQLVKLKDAKIGNLTNKLGSMGIN
jgi:predicted RNase H-like nuclease (RuvC/YqgF family)